MELRDPREQRIGPYTLVGALAHGATSEVVKAIDNDLNRLVAIKLLSRELVKNADSLARFEQESRALTGLDHANIAKVLETGVALDGRPYIVMEFVDGSSILDLIHEKAELTFAQQLDLMIQAATGLQAALNHNIIHRDVKPANLMVDRGLHLKIVDFGLAKVISESPHQSVAGVLMGTPRYMAPEVAMGRPADHRSDLYSLGATFYHMLTGQPPFDGETPAAVMMQHVNSPLIPPYMLHPEVPADICEIVEKCMAKDPNYRHGDYDELLMDLKQARVARIARERARAPLPSAPGEPPAIEPSISQPFIEADARETTAVLNPGAADETRPAGGSLRPIAPTGARRPPSYLTEGKVIAVPREEVRPEGGGWGRLLVLAMLLVLGIGGLLITTMAHEESGSERGLKGLLNGLFGRFSAGESPEARAVRQYKETLDRIAFLTAAVREYVSLTGKELEALDLLVEGRSITRKDMVDGYGGPFEYESVNRQLRAAGPDRLLHTADDFLADEQGRLLMHPEKPDAMSLEEFTSLTSEGS